MAVLLDSDGPFQKRGSVEKGHSERQLDPLALVDPPPGLVLTYRAPPSVRSRSGRPTGRFSNL